jgi:hypothetical protein
MTVKKLRAFSPDLKVLERIRPMCEADVSRVAHLHHQAMGKSLWAQLGQRFLREIYRGMLETPSFLGFVYEENGQIEGFIAGSEDTSTMMMQVFRARFHRLSIAGLLGLRNPAVLKHILETPLYFRSSNGPSSDAIPAESLFCSFTPKLRGKRVSGHINKVLFDTLLYKGHSEVKITTETDNEGANRQLQSWGFTSKGTFQFYGKEMVLYVLDLTSCERVQRLDWTEHQALANFQDS